MTDHQAPEGYEWVTCNATEYPAAGWQLHLIYAEVRRKRQHWQTTACSATASGHGIWRKPVWNSNKPLCPECARRARALMEEQRPVKPCRSVSPDGEPCVRPRGHKSMWHRSEKSSRRWDHGVNVPAVWRRPDSGRMTEADYQIQERYGI